jgi:hypothetical protein
MKTRTITISIMMILMAAFFKVDAQSNLYVPTASIFTYQGAAGTNYFGNSNYPGQILVKGDGPKRNSYLKFNLTGVSSNGVGQSLLRVWCIDKPTGTVGIKVYRCDNNWAENTITWNNAPVAVGLGASKDLTTIGQFYDIDVTALVNAALLSGTEVSFVISTDNVNMTKLSSKTNVNPPSLTISKKYFFEGNVGINTTDTKGYDLAVGGSIVAESVNVKLQQAWPDYVFKKEFNLMPIASLKEFIEKNHHLPDMPSEAEVKEKGISLGEMNSMLLRKIEELTLHIIEQDYRLKVLEATNKPIR